jgi:hypothetical protein
MNRLILVGNGFDLAHGLKTSYKDFILWYLAECAEVYKKKKYFNDDLINLSLCKDEDDHDYIQENQYINCYFENIPSCVAKSKSLLLNKLLNNINIKNWVDIEVEYFEQLKACRNKDGNFNFDTVNKLDQEFLFFKNKLEDYLTIQEQKSDHQFNPNLIGILKSNFQLSDFNTAFKGVSAFALKRKLGLGDIEINSEPKLYLINFNYTKTLAPYLDYLEDDSIFKNVEINHIHGEINNPKNPIIFGFGDEHNKEYLTFEEQRNNGLFTHIKSYQYFKTPNYRNLIRFLNSGEYQVYIMGHSCGLSDRTMFKEIFDHEHCKSVKIFHYEKPDGTNDFWEKTVNLGRHFSDKGRMRKLIVEFDEKNKFPQCN